MGPKTTLLCILDGFGLNPNPEFNAITIGKTPNFDRIFNECPSTTLTTFGERVGLPQGQMGNSEVGHLNIGAGRVVKQWLLRISNALDAGILGKSPKYSEFLSGVSENNSIHLVGLFSDGGVHSHSNHLYKLIEDLSSRTSSKILLHLITDGRDVSPYRALEQLKDLVKYLENYPLVKIATICGRYFAMDRDRRWDRTEKAFNALTQATCEKASDPVSYIQACYDSEKTDEFLEPACFFDFNLTPEDRVLFWNFREDRMRQIVEAYYSKEFSQFERSITPLSSNNILCFTDYDPKFGLSVMFEHEHISDHLGETISKLGLKQLRVAETEKYPHVTYFLNGGIEKAFAGEDRKLVPSPRDVPTYDHKPEMSAYEVRDIVVNAINSKEYDLIVVNFANCDMVGHTGILDAAVKAVETVDECLGSILSALDDAGSQAIIIADHGNAEQMLDYDTGKPHTAHTTYPVPCIVYGNSNVKELSPDGALCDIAPTVLKLMGLEQPGLMSGSSLVRN